MILNVVEKTRLKKGYSIPFIMAEYKKLVIEKEAISDHVFWQIRNNKRSITIEELLVFGKIFKIKDELKLIIRPK